MMKIKSRPTYPPAVARRIAATQIIRTLKDAGLSIEEGADLLAHVLAELLEHARTIAPNAVFHRIH